MSYILFSAVGDTDPVRGGYDGPILHIVRKYRPDKVYLFLTADMSKRDKDTDCYSRAIHHLMPECEVEKYHTDIEKANDFDAFHETFDKIINEIHEKNPNSEILLNISSATPQIKTTMCLEAVSHHVSLTPVQVSNPEKKTGKDMRHFNPAKDNLDDKLNNLLDDLEDMEDRCSVPDIRSFRKSMIKNQIKSLIGNYDYKGAYGLICENEAMFPQAAAGLLRHAYNRSKPDHKEAEKAARGIGLYDSLYPARESSVRRVCEYYLIMKIKSIRGEISDFLLRIPPIAEYLALKLLDNAEFKMDLIATFKADNESWRIDRNNAERNVPGLMAHLDKNCREGYKAFSVNLKTFLDIMAFLNVEQKNLEDFRYTMKFSALRNEAAHRLKAVTEADLKDKGIGSGELCEKFENMIRYLYKNSVKSEIFKIYDDINKRVTETLDSRSQL